MCCRMAGERLKPSQLVGGHFYRLAIAGRLKNEGKCFVFVAHIQSRVSATSPGPFDDIVC